MNENLYNVHMGKAKCAVDLGDGSERGEYVNQDSTRWADLTEASA